MPKNYTPVFRLSIGRMFVKTNETFQAEDPWNGNRLTHFAVDDYRLLWYAGCSMPAIWSESNGMTRFLPDSLCDLYEDGTVPPRALPVLLNGIEGSLVRSDFLPVLRNPVFPASYIAFVGISLITIVGTGLVLLGLNASLPRSALIMSALIGVCSLWWQYAYRRKLTRRKQQKQYFIDALHEFDGRPQRILSLEEIQSIVNRYASKISAPPDELPTYGRPEGFARPYIESDDAYHLVINDRGVELDRHTTSDLYDLQYEVFKIVASGMATAYERAHRIPGRDFRRLWFEKQLELLAELEPAWRDRRSAELQEILRRVPYEDNASSNQLPTLDDSGTTDIAILSDRIRSSLPDFEGGQPRFWGDWHGRPGDMRYRIASCEVDQGTLRLHFTDGEILTIWSPEDLLMDRQTFRILRADRVRWEWTGSVGPRGEPKRFFSDYVAEGGRCLVKTSDERIRYLRPTLDKPAVDITW